MFLKNASKSSSATATVSAYSESGQIQNDIRCFNELFEYILNDLLTIWLDTNPIANHRENISAMKQTTKNRLIKTTGIEETVSKSHVTLLCFEWHTNFAQEEFVSEGGKKSSPVKIKYELFKISSREFENEKQMTCC